MIAFGDFDVLSFDCYGTLIDWETGLVQALHPILQAHGVQQGDEEVLAAYAVAEAAAEGGAYQGYRAVLATALRDLGALYRFTPSPEELERFATSVGDWPAFPDTPGALARLARRFKLAVITNCDDDLFARSHRRLGVAFDWVITAQQARSYKPSLCPFQVALARIGVPPARLLHVAQSLFHDHVPAQQLGLTTVWVNRRHDKPGAGATPPAAAVPDLEVPDLRTLVDMVGC
jgi:2-haloacid dehalogenase